MGMTIEDIIQGLKEIYMICRSVFAYDQKKYIDGAIDRLHKYQQLQADYENRLKADMVAMLIELRQDIIAESWHIESLDINANDSYDLVVQISDVDKIIQQKINALRGNAE